MAGMIVFTKVCALICNSRFEYLLLSYLPDYSCIVGLNVCRRVIGFNGSDFCTIKRIPEIHIIYNKRSQLKVFFITIIFILTY